MSTYKPRRQGRRDAREGKPRFAHKSEWNQREYDVGYAEGERELAEQQRREAAREPSLEEINEALLEALEKMVAAWGVWVTENIGSTCARYEMLAKADRARAAITKARGA